MNATTKTGLLASPRKNIPHRKKKTVDLHALLPCAITRQAPIHLKPFAGLYNPYSKGCSVLCNHPCGNEIRNVVQQAKSSWAVQGKAFTYTKEELKIGKLRNDLKNSDLPDHVPEEFFRRYTDTDSRPLTPTPTVASGRTRTSAIGSHLNRRCMTPEPISSNDGKERKQIILDLRRSHSQETLYWNASSELSPRQPESISSSWMQSHNKAILETDEMHKSGDIDDIAELDEIEEEENADIVDYDGDGDANKSATTCINARDDDDDEPRRRGKRRKKSKPTAQMITFTPNTDPETQVATLGPDSPNQSARPSIPDVNVTTTNTKSIRKTDDFFITDKSFFLDDEALKVLRLGLNLEIVEEVFERYRHRALQEALKTIPPEKLENESDAVREVKETLNLPEIDHQRWMELPRKYTRSSCRFELPIDMKELSRLNVIDYLSRYVFIQSDKKQLYHRIFLKYLPAEKLTRDDNENEDNLFGGNFNNRNIRKANHLNRTLPIELLDTAMKEVLGFHGTDAKINEIRDLLNIAQNNEIEIDYRTFCGIIAFSERYILNTKLGQPDDPRNEIEIADFESLERRIKTIQPKDTLLKVLEIIKMY